MELSHRFTVPGTVEDTWERFADIADLAQCFPGAQVTSAEGDTFEGTVKVKLGPIALVYAGSGRFVSRDADAHSFVVEAKGRDKRGNGTAGATVTVAMSSAGPAGAAATEVQVDTDLSITGKPAQFGRGVMQDVSDKLLGQFVACLEQRSGPAEPAGELAADPSVQAWQPPESVPASAPPDGGPSDAGPSDTAPSDAAASSLAAGAAVGGASLGGASVGATTAGGAPAGGASAGGADDALDLGATVLPVLLRSYGKQLAAGLGAVALLIIAWRRRRGR